MVENEGSVGALGSGSSEQSVKPLSLSTSLSEGLVDQDCQEP